MALVGKKLRYWRELRKITQKQVADAAALQRSHISMLEGRPTTEAGYVTVKALAKALGVLPENLTDEVAEVEKTEGSLLDPDMEVFFSTDGKELTEEERALLRSMLRMLSERVAERKRSEGEGGYQAD